jgi:hypothetical protein
MPEAIQTLTHVSDQMRRGITILLLGLKDPDPKEGGVVPGRRANRLLQA